MIIEKLESLGKRRNKSIYNFEPHLGQKVASLVVSSPQKRQ